MTRTLKFLFPLVLGILLLAFWEGTVRVRAIPPYILPAPSAVIAALVRNFGSLMLSLASTLAVTLEGFIVALIAGVGLAILFSQSRVIERTLYPYAVVLQVTPVVAIAPLIMIWVGFDHIECGVGPDRRPGCVLSHSFQHHAGAQIRGLQSGGFDAPLWRFALADLWRLRLPTALPYLLGAMKIAGGLSLIGAVVAEFVAGSGTATGLAWRIVEAGNRLEVATMFAALMLLALLGIVIFVTLSLLEWALLRRWHESALKAQL